MKTLFHEISYKDALEGYDLAGLLEPLLNGGYSLHEFKEYLSRSALLESINHKGSGFFLYEPMGDSVEVHAFIPPHSRKLSTGLLRALMGYFTQDMGFSYITTTVTSDYEYLVRFLKILGFKVSGVETGTVVKPTGVFNATYLIYTKE